ncbi:hypothetical protein DTO021C3_4447 [Paecilomyces variotii]|nr:hypothetical protein DTO021C3_4447 [Paecilomyces variotii]
MALTPVEHTFHVPPPDPVEPPPDVAVTPCDPWPAPYYLEGGLRRVKPYHYTYNTYCKERWRGRELLEIFLSEFRDREPEYYKWAIETGQVTVGGKTATTTTKVLNGQVVSHTLHRHEPPVTAQPIGVIHEDDDMLVIDKPAGVPVHSAGRYHFNSIVEILRAERGGWKPLPCNRLDRLTSGVMFIGKHPKAAEKIAKQLQERSVQKEYIARVKGKFPEGVVVCDQPIVSVSPKLGLNRVRATGKHAKTKFRRVAYYPPRSQRPQVVPENGDNTDDGRKAATPPPSDVANEDDGYSIVHCLPLTGRTHQIRVHLQFLGHPITNDPIYSNRRVFGPDLGKNESSSERDQEIIERLSAMGKTEMAETVAYRTHLTTPPRVPPGTDPAVIDQIMAREHDAAVVDYYKKKGEKLSGKKCEICNTELYTDPGPHELGIYLHAVAYADKAGDWKYCSKMPSWALPPPGMDGLRETPDWKDAEEGEEITIGGGTIPGMIEDDEGTKDEVQALVRGVGIVDISGTRAEGQSKGEQESPFPHPAEEEEVQPAPAVISATAS